MAGHFEQIRICGQVYGKFFLVFAAVAGKVNLGSVKIKIIKKFMIWHDIPANTTSNEKYINKRLWLVEIKVLVQCLKVKEMKSYRMDSTQRGICFICFVIP